MEMRLQAARKDKPSGAWCQPAARGKKAGHWHDQPHNQSAAPQIEIDALQRDHAGEARGLVSSRRRSLVSRAADAARDSLLSATAVI
jgi:hypothetical protein